MRPSIRRRVLLVPVLVALTVAAVHLAESLKQGEDALIQRRYGEAVRALTAALPEAVPEDRDRILLLLGRAQLLDGDARAAVATWNRLVQEHGGSPLVHQARFQEAAALARQGDHRAAAPIYRDEIARLIGVERKEEIAGTYLGLAEEARNEDPPHHTRAVTFFDLALDLGLPGERARTVRLMAAEALLESGNAAGAVQRLDPLVDELEVGQGKLRAMLVLGKAKRLRGQSAAARTVLRDLRALDRDAAEAADAAHEIALSYGVPEPQAAYLDRAVRALDVLAADHPAHAKARIAHFLAARCYRHVGRTGDALVRLRRFLDEQGDSGLEEVARARALVGDVLAAQGRYQDAITAWRAYLSAHPAHRDWERVQRAIVQAELQLALRAYEAGPGRFGEARERFDSFVRKHPLHGANPRILYLLGEMHAEEEDFERAREAFARCVSKYPGKDASSHAQFRIGEIYEIETFDHAKALEAYEKVTWGPWQQEARRRIARLERVHLELLTPRVFRTDEEAHFELTSRNVEEVRVRVFRLDLEDYFRATHTAGEIEKLDIEVIEPDRTFEETTPEYQPYRETSREVAIGFGEPGAYVVKADNRELEATTMVLVSDLALIAKSSRHEFFVFTQNTREDRPQGGVRVVLSDGERVVAEGATDDRGGWSYRGEALRQHDRLRVFAVDDDSGSGAGDLDLSGMGYSQGLTAKGYLFTDRPAYRPGQTVQIKGIVREVAGGVYSLPEAKDYRMQVLGADGRLMMQRPVEFTGFGTFAGTMVLPEEAALGEWRVTVSRPGPGSRTFTGSFRVAHYQRPKLALRAELDEPVVFRGESIRGRFVLETFFGEPAAGREIAYQLRLPDGAVMARTGTTDGRGEVAFSFPTTDFAEEAMAVVQGRVRVGEASTRAVVPVVTTELEAGIETVRDVYLAGEPFDVDVTLRDRTGKPVAREGEVVLLRLEKKEIRSGRRPEPAPVEVEVARVAFTTGDDGRAKVGLVAEEGGPHRLRVDAVDRFDNVVTAQEELTISGAGDEVKLRLLTDRESYEVGETVAVQVVNRTDPYLMLETVQGDGILSWRTRVLPAGESTIEVDLGTLHAPNFALSLAMIDGTRLRTAERAFRVRRELQVAVEPRVENARPGGEVQVDVRVRDPRGQGVVAEVALAMVDEALLELFPDRTPAMAEHFYGQLRETAFRTSSSCSWSYRGEPEQVSEALLAEERRREALRRAREEAGRADNGYGPGPAGPGAAGPPSPGPEGRRPANEPTTTGSDDFYFGGLARGIGGGAGGRYGGRRADRPSDEPRTDFSATGAWLSSVVTDGDGNATVTIELPDSTTGWQLVGRAVTRATDVGEGEGHLTTSKPLQAELIAPRVLTEGDRLHPGVRVHNLEDDEREVDVAFTTIQDGRESRQSREVTVPGHGQREPTFDLEAGDSGVRVRIDARSGDRRDVLERAVEVRPWGVERRVGAAGSTRERARAVLSLPAGREYTALSMTVGIGPEPGRDLVAAALGQGFRPLNCIIVRDTNLARASRGLAAVRVLEGFGQTRGAGPATRSRLEGAVRGALSALVAAQNDDGGWPWIARGPSHARTTSQALRFLARTRARGLPEAEAAADRASAWLLPQLRRAPTTERPDLLWALATVDRARFDALNAVHRSRDDLDLDGLARLALAWQAQGRGALAGEVLEVLRGRLELPDRPTAGQVRAVALAARALLVRDSGDRDGERAVEWLRGRRRGVSWGTPEATAAAIAALLQATVFPTGERSAGEITVIVNGHEVGTVPPSGARMATRFEVPPEWLQPRDNRLEVRVRGGVTAHYDAVLGGFARGFEAEDRNQRLARVRRWYLAAFRRHDGEVVRPGFSVVTGRGHETWENEITALRAGETGRVRTRFHIPGEPQREAIGPILIEEPLPAGCVVPRSSVKGNFDHVIVEPHRLLLYYREGRTTDHVTYEVHARHTGVWKVLPTRLQGASRPDLIAYGRPGELTVHPADSEESDPYRLTPDELYHLGTAEYEDGDRARAWELLGRLLADWHREEVRLRDDVFKEVARMRLFLAVERGDDGAVVRHFEQLKDHYPDLVIPFDKILAVGEAYLGIGEFEAANMVFRAAAEASFLKDAAVATTLEKLGEVRASVGFLQRLLREYPDLNTMRMSRYGIGQKLAKLAADRDPAAPVDEKVGSVAELRKRALQAFREFLILYPEDPLAEEVSFAWATTWLEGEALEQALEVAEDALARYRHSVFEDEFLYTKGYAHFALGQHEEAFTALEKVAEGTFSQPGGGSGPSENRDHAIYLQGQIHHARGEPAKALAAYERVEKKFSDASEAADYFLRKRLALPEVTTFGLGDDVEVELRHRNVADVSVQIFRVDLMRLYLLEKSLDDIRGILLHGIRPTRSLELELGDGRDYKERIRTLELDLAEAGAYLVVVRGGDQLATGMVLRSDLSIETQEATDVGQIRVNVLQDGAFLADAHVKVVGSGDGRFRTGDTDLRGVFVARGLVGQATVIVKKADQYAFYRGEAIHQPGRYRPAPEPPRQEGPAEKQQQREGEPFDALRNNLQLNIDNRARQMRWLQDEVLDKDQKGVEVFRTK